LPGLHPAAASRHSRQILNYWRIQHLSIPGLPSESGPYYFALKIKGKSKISSISNLAKANSFPGFKDNGDGTITDLYTGLVWVKDAAGPGGNNGEPLSWKKAVEFANNLEFAGYDDWRLPNFKELQSIINYTKSPAVYADFANIIRPLTYSAGTATFFKESREIKGEETEWNRAMRGGEIMDVETGESYKIIDVFNRGGIKIDSPLPAQTREKVPYNISYSTKIYWTSSSIWKGEYEPAVFRVDFKKGEVYAFSRDTALYYDNLFVLPVRGQSNVITTTGQGYSYEPGDDGDLQMGCELNQNYTDFGNGTIADNCSNLLWMDYISYPDSPHTNWEQAAAHINQLEFAGYDDWRLPNILELTNIMNFRHIPRTCGVLLHGKECPPEEKFIHSCWSSTTDSTGNRAWKVNFEDFFDVITPLEKERESFPRAVRALEP